MAIKNIISFLILLFVLTSCEKKTNNLTKIINIMETIKDVPQKEWDLLANKKIFFGHQSVGYNMIDGIETILKESSNIKLNIKKGKDLNLFISPVFAHNNNGSNRDPKSKIDAFCKAMEEGLGDKVDMAGFKFCYVDFEDGSDALEIFNYYKKKMDEITIKYPKVKIIHFTCPIRSLQKGPKGIIKKLLGKDIGIKDNIARQEFNELLLKEYKGKAVFDLAKAESTYSDGSREYSEVDGKKIFTMIPAYTNDGGHLSKKGKLIIGSDFLFFLANLI